MRKQARRFKPMSRAGESFDLSARRVQGRSKDYNDPKGSKSGIRCAWIQLTYLGQPHG
jgi:hypothetical protein